uniref:K Homology domain-containing protein n=1 Tax=Ananas comosus var. bracteatus TaxID=296719 RepID=A0A6V7PWB5_ANACO|nr:unnamed protein product [Ananas comosus var. bracteatus]
MAGIAPAYAENGLAAVSALPSAAAGDGSEAAAEQLVGAAAAGSAEEAAAQGAEIKKWPGWPGDNVFRLIVPVLMVGSIIGRKGELIKKLCEETRARIRILDGPVGTTERIVLIHGREEPEEEISPAMDAVVRVFKRLNGYRMLGLMAKPQHLLGRLYAQSVCWLRLLKPLKLTFYNFLLLLDERPFYATEDERIVDIQGESLKVLKALESVISHLRKFLVDHGVLPLFDKASKVTTATQDVATDSWNEKTQPVDHSSQQAVMNNEYSLPARRDSLFLDREPQLDSQMSRSSLSLYGRDPAALSGLRSSSLGRTAGPVITQITQTMQVPLSYAEDIIGVAGGNIRYIRATSGALLTVEETRGVPDEITIEIKGTASQVQTAQQLIEEFMAGHRDPLRSSYGGLDTSYRSSYSQISSAAYPSSSLASHSLGGYGSSAYGGYSSASSYRF